MERTESINIRLLTLDDIEGWLKQCEILSYESGKNDVYFGPYSKHDPYPMDEIKKNTKERWSKSIDTPGWRRAWGIFYKNRIVGSADIAGGDISKNLHRVDFGIGIIKEYRNMGLGKELMYMIIDWCKEHPGIFWIDLGVFSDNDKAKLVFEKVGFEEIGYKDDCWYIDGVSIGETTMTLNVKR